MIPNSVRKILVLRNGGLGDTLLLVPFLRLLRTQFPTWELRVMGRKEVLDVLVREGEIHTALSFDREGIWNFFSTGGKIPSNLIDFFSSHAKIYSLVNDPHGVFNGNLRSVVRGEVVCAPPFPPPPFPFHVSWYYVNIIEKGIEMATGGGRVSSAVKPFVKREEDLSALAPYFREWRVAPPKDRLLALHPGSGSPYKNWPLEFFRETARTFGERGWTVLWILGPVEEEKGEDSPGAGENIIPVRLPLTLLSPLLKHCTAYLGNDSGVSHLAGWTGIPALILFGPSDPFRWKPLGPGVRVISRGLGCSPCPQEEWGKCPKRRCLLEISVEEVLCGLP